MQKLQILKTTLAIGLEKPVKLLHITDTHIALDDDRVSNRARCFEGDNKGQTAAFFMQAISYAKENAIPIVHTGDLIDFFSDANFRFVDEYFSNVEYMYAAGNHDFCHWVGEATEDLAYKWEMIKTAAPHFKSNLYFDSRIIGDLNIVTLDNSYYRITDGQIDMLKAEVAKGYPVLLCMHVPLFTPELACASSGKHSGVSYVMGAPTELLAKYPADRRVQQAPDDATLRAIDYIKGEPQIKALLTGHCHLNHEQVLENGLVQITTHGTFAGYVREITVY